MPDLIDKGFSGLLLFSQFVLDSGRCWLDAVVLKECVQVSTTWRTRGSCLRRFP
jgi:hypothetical protein